MLNHTLVKKLTALLEAERFHDYAPNGLQVEGKESISRIIAGVTASQALLDEAVQQKADAVLVHHGWFWKGESPCLTGIRRSRARTVLGAGLNLIAYHLPLDAHPVLGNNAQLAKRLGILPENRWGEYELGWTGRLASGPETAAQFALRAEKALGRKPLLAGDPNKVVSRVCWCSGAAQREFEEAISQGADLYFSGEISEPTFHLACESGVPYLACGHHATERFGIQALGKWIEQNCGIEVVYVDIENPV